MKNDSVAGTVFSLLGGVFWGLGGMSGQYLTQNGICSAEWICCCKMLTAGLVMLLAASFHGRKHFFDVFKNKKDCVQILVFALFGMLLCQYTFFKTVALSNSATASTLQYLCPILILIYTCRREQKRPEPKEIFCVMLAFFGVMTLVTHLKADALALSPGVVACGLASAVFYAMYTVQPKGIIRTYGVLLMNGWGLLLGGLMMLPLAKPWRETVQPGISGLVALLLIFFRRNGFRKRHVSARREQDRFAEGESVCVCGAGMHCDRVCAVFADRVHTL
ncbi:MAG: DMT family transporter [Clostridiales bacterium]|nr:DMT family transporter [Clostridiales bacterium]